MRSASRPAFGWFVLAGITVASLGIGLDLLLSRDPFEDTVARGDHLQARVDSVLAQIPGGDFAAFIELLFSARELTGYSAINK